VTLHVVVAHTQHTHAMSRQRMVALGVILLLAVMRRAIYFNG
jgi:hypothetical protein